VKRLAVLPGIALLAVVLVGFVRTVRLESRQVAPATVASIAVDARAAAERLASSLRLQTISWDDVSRRDTSAFLALHQHLERSFPRTTAALPREPIANYSLLYTWSGTRPDLPPLIFAAHLDVVPAESNGGRQWTHLPFAGDVDAAWIWGRGAIDDKSAVMGLLEAVEALLAEGFQPARTIYLAFGHNEEGGGDASGAAAIAATLANRGIRNAWLLDEGGLIYDRVPGVAQPVAFIGVTEKSALVVEVAAHAAGGHAAMPPDETAVAILARALDRITRHPLPARLDGAALATFTTLAPEMSLPMRAAFANLWLTRPVVLRRLTNRADTNALVRTTIAQTVLEASPKVNVLPTEARALLNIRLLPGDSFDVVGRHLLTVIDDKRVSVKLIAGGAPPPPLSPINTPEFAQLQASIRAVYPEVLVSPYLTIAGTDAREYRAIAPASYRFLPIYQDGALEAIHGVDEHITIDAYMKAIRVYAAIMQALGTRH
jgi:carboxypeptidase PM20D1